MKCKGCKREVHYCTSCDYDRYNDAGYCSAQCYIKTEEWNIFAKRMQEFYDSLSKDQKLELWCLWDNGIFIDDKWEDYLDDVIEDPRGDSKEPSTGD